jgi:hypothetical protein
MLGDYIKKKILIIRIAVLAIPFEVMQYQLKNNVGMV